MTLQSNFSCEIRPLEVLRETPFTATMAQEAVRRLRSDPGLMIILATPTETAGVRAIERLAHLLVDFGIPFSTDSTTYVELGNGACLRVVVDVNMQEGRCPTAPPRRGGRGAHRVRDGARG